MLCTPSPLPDRVLMRPSIQVKDWLGRGHYPGQGFRSALSKACVQVGFLNDSTVTFTASFLDHTCIVPYLIITIPAVPPLPQTFCYIEAQKVLTSHFLCSEWEDDSKMAWSLLYCWIPELENHVTRNTNSPYPSSNKLIIAKLLSSNKSCRVIFIVQFAVLELPARQHAFTRQECMITSLVPQ